MSAEDVGTKAKYTLKSVMGLLEKAEQTVEKEFRKAAPAVQKSLDESLQAASKAFASTMKTIDSRTESEQLGFLRAYRKFLGGQVEYVESRLRPLEERAAARNPDQAERA